MFTHYNTRFNAELAQQIAGTLPKGHIYRLGFPGRILRAAGFPNSPIEMSATRLAEKSVQENHPFNISDMYDLVLFINEPIAVFRYGAKAKNIIVDIVRDGRQYLIGVHFNQMRHDTIVSDIRGIFPKDNIKWLNWIAQGKADYLHKEKIQTLIDQQRTNSADVAYLDLDFVNQTSIDKQRTNSAEVAYLDLDFVTKIVQTEHKSKLGKETPQRS